MTDLRCPKCGEANVAGRAPLVELIGQQIVCGLCGGTSLVQIQPSQHHQPHHAPHQHPRGNGMSLVVFSTCPVHISLNANPTRNEQRVSPSGVPTV
jgi:hypothetical protein